MKKLILHIGRPKTGSSAIQHFLWSNRKRLLDRHGILYPESVMHHRASHKLALVFQPYLPAYHVVGDKTPEQVYGVMFEEADAVGARAILASSENFFLVDPAKLSRLLPRRWETKIICYVRRQDHVIASSLVQEIKTGSVDINTDTREYVRNKERLAWLDYDAVLKPWSKAFGTANMTVRVYEEPGSGWDIYRDFTDAVGISNDDLEVPAERINPSPSRDVLDFIRIINGCDEIPDARKPLLRIPLLRASERMGASGGFDSHRMISPALRHELLVLFEGSNRAVARKYLGRKNGSLFDHEVIADDQNVVEYQGMELTRFAYMSASIMCSMQARIDKLEALLERQMRSGEK